MTTFVCVWERDEIEIEKSDPVQFISKIYISHKRAPCLHVIKQNSKTPTTEKKKENKREKLKERVLVKYI